MSGLASAPHKCRGTRRRGRTSEAVVSPRAGAPPSTGRGSLPRPGALQHTWRGLCPPFCLVDCHFVGSRAATLQSHEAAAMSRAERRLARRRPADQWASGPAARRGGDRCVCRSADGMCNKMAPTAEIARGTVRLLIVMAACLAVVKTAGRVAGGWRRLKMARGPGRGARPGRVRTSPQRSQGLGFEAGSGYQGD